MAKLRTRHFSRSFKEATGATPYQYITLRRHENAKALILEGRLSLTEIAAETGFAKHSHLSTAFRAAFMTPSQFRNTLR